MDAKHFRIAQSARATGRKCPVTGEWINGTRTGWQLAMGNGLVSDEGRKQAPAKLLAIFEEMESKPAERSEIEYAVVHVDSIAYESPNCAVDFMTGGKVHRGPGVEWAVANVVGTARLLGPDAAWRLAPTLATALYNAGQLPPKPLPPPPPPVAPPPPPPPTRAELQAVVVDRLAKMLERDAESTRAILDAITEFAGI